MPLQAFNTDANGTMFHNMFSPQILSNKQCYLNSQIQTLVQTVQNNVMPANNRYFSDGLIISFIPESPNETLSPPASAGNRRLIHLSGANNKQIINGTGASTTLSGTTTSISESLSTTSTFGVFTSKCWAYMVLSNNGTILSASTTSHGLSVLGVAQNPLFTTDLANTRFCNHFCVALSGPGGNTITAARLQNMTTSNTIGFRTSANNTNYTFQCSANSGDGTTIGSLWATHLALVDSTAAPNDFCIGTISPIVLLGRGAYTLGNLYKFNNVGEGTANANAYDRWYVAGPTYGSGGDRLLMQIYYEP